MKHAQEIDIHKIGPHGTLKSYVIGFILSMALTLFAFFLVDQQVLQSSDLVITIVTLAVIQMVIQLIFFFHMNKESPPFWNLCIFLFMALVLGIVVIGTLWVMYHLNYNMDMSHMPTHGSF